MTNMLWTYADPLAMRNIDAERTDLGLEPLHPRVSRPAPSSPRGSIHWWVLKYEEAGRALTLDGKHDGSTAGT